MSAVDAKRMDATVATTEATIHPITAHGPGSLGERLERWSHPSFFRPLVAPLPLPVARVSGPPGLLEEAAAGLPEGPAQAEAVAVRLRRRGVRLLVGTPEDVVEPAVLVRSSYARGASSVDVLRVDPSLVSELQIGSWFHVSARTRALRTTLLRLPRRLVLRRDAGGLALRCEVAFWAGVRSAATPREWRRLTTSSYVCLTYHRIAGQMKPGQERLDVSPKKFERQMRLLRLLGFRPLAPEELIRFHADPTATLPRRSYVLTADDGFVDAVTMLRRHGRARPQLFVTTAAVGNSAGWADAEPLAGWDELQALSEAGAAIGSHGTTHTALTELDDDALEQEMAHSLAEVGARVSGAVPFLAYPHGAHDLRVRSSARRAGYRLAYTTRPGRNGAGTDPHCLRRIGVKDWDGSASFLWKLVSGEHVPQALERRRARRAQAGALR